MSHHEDEKDAAAGDNAPTSNGLYGRLRSAPYQLYSWLQAVTKPIREAGGPSSENIVRINPTSPASGGTSRRLSRMSTTSRKDVEAFVLEPNSTRKLLRERDTSISLLSELPPDVPAAERVLHASHLQLLHAAMPPRWRICSQWRLAYSTRRDGFSLTTLYQRCRYVETPLVLAIRDEGGAVFGAWSTEAFKPRIGHYGTGECFLWRVLDAKSASKLEDERKPHSDHHPALAFEAFGTTGKNNYYLVSEPSYLAAGVSGGVFGLWVDEQLLAGSSRPTLTYDNPCLASSEEFECAQVEVWELVKRAE